MPKLPKGLKDLFNNASFKKVAIWSAIGVVLLYAFNKVNENKAEQAKQKITEQVEAEKGMTVPYTDFVRRAHAHEFKRIDKMPDGETYRGTNGNVAAPLATIAPSQDVLLKDLQKEFDDNQLIYNVMPAEKKPEIQAVKSPGSGGFGISGGFLTQAFFSFGPMILMLGIMIYFMKKQAGGANQAGGFGKSKAKMLDESTNNTTFADVAGCDEAKEEVKEVVDFLRNPQLFQKIGAKIPRGILLVGPPGTGKTLLAKAMAGEAKVPFFSISGSGFVEMFVGVGASRVRDMFEEAKKNAPCIIFIDEIDAVGRHRGQGMGGGNDEREQTLNQMLVEMDGFETNLGVLIVAATNRPDILDPALLRPGRFDRQVFVTLPDIRGREQVLKVHMRKIPVHPQVDASIIARGTPGMSGADLANLCNEAALMAGRRKVAKVEMQDFDKAKDKIFMGPERKSMVMPEQERRNTAYHETGHMLMNRKLKHLDPFYKMTIIPRGRALGVSISLPEEDRFSIHKARLKDEMVHLYGGWAAEITKFGREYVTTGASNDIERASSIARNMVSKWGMSEKLGRVRYVTGEGMSMMGPGATQMEPVSEKTKEIIDAEVREMTDLACEQAIETIAENAELFEKCAQALLKWETLNAAHIDAIERGEDIDAIMEEERKAEHNYRESRKETITIGLTSGSNDNDGNPPAADKGLFPMNGPKPK